jgi:hypothetical protein
MAIRKTAKAADLQSYYQGRIESMAKRLIDISDALFTAESIQQRKEFDDHVERRLQNGAKFVPRKEQPR